MNPTIAEAFRRAIAKGRNLAPNGEALTLERITQIFGNGQVQVSCQAYGPAVIPVTGEGLRTLRAGQKVAVAWEKGRPVTAIAHTAKRSGAPVPLPSLLAPLVEELFIGTRPEDGVTDVFLRTFDAVTPLRLDRFILPSEISTLRWGARNDRFFVQRLTRYHIFKFDREPDEPFDAGEDPSDLLALERTEDLSTNTMTLATLTFPTPLVVAANNPIAQRIAVQLDVDGALIVSYELSLSQADSVPGSVPAANFDSSGIDSLTNATFTDTMSWPIIADLTNQVVLLSGFDTPHLFAALGWSLFDWNGTARVAFTKHTIDVLGFVRPVTWVSANSFTTPIDPPFEGHTEIVSTWQFGYSETPSGIRCVAEPTLVLGNALPAEQRVRGLVAWTRLSYNIFLGQTFDVANWNAANGHGYFPFSGQAGFFPVAPSAPFPVTPQTGALARAALAATLVELAPIARPALGLSYAPTLHRVIWRQPGAVAFQSASAGLNVGGADSPGFVTLLDGGATVQVSPTLRASIGQRARVPVLTDFLYQLDNPAVALPAQAEVNFFVDAWDFGGPTTLDTTATDFPSELAELEPVKELADLPAGVTQPTSFGLFSLYVNNEPETLEAAGLFEELPG